MKKRAKELKKAMARHGITITETEVCKSGHIKAYLQNGRFIIVSGSPSDKNAFWSMKRDARRELAKGDINND